VWAPLSVSQRSTNKIKSRVLGLSRFGSNGPCTKVLYGPCKPGVCKVKGSAVLGLKLSAIFDYTLFERGAHEPL